MKDLYRKAHVVLIRLVGLERTNLSYSLLQFLQRLAITTKSYGITFKIVTVDRPSELVKKK